MTVLPRITAPAASRWRTTAADGVRDAPGEEGAAVLRRHPGGVHDVLHAHRDAVQRPQGSGLPARPRRVRRGPLGRQAQRPLRIDPGEGPQPGLEGGLPAPGRLRRARRWRARRRRRRRGSAPARVAARRRAPGPGATGVGSWALRSRLALTRDLPDPYGRLIRPRYGDPGGLSPHALESPRRAQPGPLAGHPASGCTGRGCSCSPSSPARSPSATSRSSGGRCPRPAICCWGWSPPSCSASRC